MVDDDTDDGSIHQLEDRRDLVATESLTEMNLATGEEAEEPLLEAAPLY